MSILLQRLGVTAQSAARSVWNDPQTAVHVERCLLSWLLDWDPDCDLSVRSYIARRAANETRRLRAMDSEPRRKHYSHMAFHGARIVRSGVPAANSEKGEKSS